MQKIKNKKYYTKHLSSPSDVRDLGKHGLDCQELLRSMLDPETTHTLYDGQWMMVVDDVQRYSSYFLDFNATKVN